MPIQCKEEIKLITEQEFHKIDYDIMNTVFSIHNSLGRFLDEKLYNKALTEMIPGSHREVEISVLHKDYTKKYYLDILIENSVIYELKTVTKLNSIHRLQLLNYLFLTNSNHGKLINFRPASVEYEFVSTKINKDIRFSYKFDTNYWNKSDELCIFIEQKLKDLFADWGGFLDVDLYKSALIYFLGGEDNLETNIDILFNNKKIGEQKVILLNKNTTIHFSAVADNYEKYMIHLKRFLYNSNLKSILWININKETIILNKITK